MQTIFETQSLSNASPPELMRKMLLRLGEAPNRDGLRILPNAGTLYAVSDQRLQENPAEILLGAMFDVAYDEMVILKDIEMFSPANTICCLIRA